MKKKSKTKRKRLYDSVIVLFMLMAIIVNVFVIGVANYVYTAGIKNCYERITSATAQVIASSVYGNSVADMFEKSDETDYDFLKKQVIETVKQTPDLERAYIYDMRRDGMYLLVDSDNVDSEIGEKFAYPDNLSKLIDDFYEGKKPETFESSNGGHNVMTALVPIYDIRNNCVCYVGCDMNLDKAYKNIEEFTTELAKVVVIPTMIIAFVVSIYIQKKVLGPIRQLDTYLKSYEQD